MAKKESRVDLHVKTNNPMRRQSYSRRESQESREWRFSLVDEPASPVFRDDFDEMPWNEKNGKLTDEVETLMVLEVTTPHQFEFNPTRFAPRLRSRTNSLNTLKESSPIASQTCVSEEEKDNVFDGTYHSMYISPHPKGWRGIVVLLQSPALLLLIGLFSAFLGLWLDATILRLTSFHQELASSGFIAFLAFSLIAATIDTLLVHYISPEAAGSGVPQMKVALSGVDMQEFLSPRCFVVKMLGLILSYSAALSIGKEGPFIMISCCFAESLMQMGLFRRIHNDSAKRLEMLACACAAGVAATFGTPFGGVLFSVEITSSFYMVRNLPRSFFAALSGSITISFLVTNGNYGLFDRSAGLGITDTDFTREFTAVDMGIFILIGIVCGILGAIFIFTISMLVRARDRWLLSSRGPSLLYKRLGIVLCVTIIANMFDFYGDPAWFLHHGSPQTIIATLFTKSSTVEEGAELARTLVTFFPLKYILTIICVVVPLPAGVFTPTFIIGGIFGRMIGGAIQASQIISTNFEPFEFAIIGAAAFSTGVTRAISTAVIIMEVSHNGYLTIPVSIAILAAYFTGGRFSENVYDVLITTARLPRLQKLPKSAYDIPSWEVMKPVETMIVLSADANYKRAEEMLYASNDPVFPIVDNMRSMHLIGAVTRTRLQQVLDYCHIKAKTVQAIKDDKAKDLMEWPIQFAYRRGGHILSLASGNIVKRTKLTVLVNPSPFQVVDMTTMQRVDAVFRMLKLNNAYVTHCGQLVGVISRARLMRFLSTTTKYRIPGVLKHIKHMITDCCPKDKRPKPKDEPNFDDYVEIP